LSVALYPRNKRTTIIRPMLIEFRVTVIVWVHVFFVRSVIVDMSIRVFHVISIIPMVGQCANSSIICGGSGGSWVSSWL